MAERGSQSLEKSAESKTEFKPMYSFIYLYKMTII